MSAAGDSKNEAIDLTLSSDDDDDDDDDIVEVVCVVKSSQGRQEKSKPSAVISSSPIDSNTPSLRMKSDVGLRTAGATTTTAAASGKNLVTTEQSTGGTKVYPVTHNTSVAVGAANRVKDISTTDDDGDDDDSENYDKNSHPPSPQTWCSDCPACRQNPRCGLCLPCCSSDEGCVFQPCRNLAKERRWILQRSAQVYVTQNARLQSNYQQAYGRRSPGTSDLYASTASDDDDDSTTTESTRAGMNERDETYQVEDSGKTISREMERRDTDDDAMKGVVVEARSTEPASMMSAAVPTANASKNKRKRDKSLKNYTKVAKRVKSKRCLKCEGCMGVRCHKCTFCRQCPGGQQCTFRPCIVLSQQYNQTLRCHARKLLNSTTDHQLQLRYEQYYGSLVEVDDDDDDDTPPPRCGQCLGCTTRKCGLCILCNAKSDSTQCFFRPCSKNFVIDTMTRYRKGALETLQSRRHKDNKSSLRQSFQKVSGTGDFQQSQELGQAAESALSARKENKDVAKTLFETALYAEKHATTEEANPKEDAGCGNTHEAVSAKSDGPAVIAGRKTAKGRATPCQKCKGCRENRCGHCVPCKEGPKTRRRCAFLRCDNVVYAACTHHLQKQLARRAVKATQKSDGTSPLDGRYAKIYGDQRLPSKRCRTRLEVGTRVYCLWPDNEMYYFGLVVSANETKTVFEVHFDDDTSRKDVPICEMVTEAEYTDDFGANAWKEETSKLSVNSLCYARYSNDEYYWGKIKSITGNGDSLMYSIEFCDGDELDGVPRLEIRTRQEYYDLYHKLPKPGCYAMAQDEMPMVWAPGQRENADGFDAATTVGLMDLAKERCSRCMMCKKDCCQKCFSCKANKERPRSKKLMCLKKMCLQIPVQRKRQPMQGDCPQVYQFKFYFTCELPEELKSQRPAHEELKDLVITTTTGGLLFRTLEDAAASVGLRTNLESFKKMASWLYEDVLGVDMTTRKNHLLLGKGFKHTWRGIENTFRQAFGKIAEYRTNLIDGTSHFKIEFGEPLGNHLRRGAIGQDKISTWDYVDEADAWGGHLAWLREEACPERDFPKNLPFRRRYFVPSRVEQHSSSNGRPKVSFVVKGFRLVLEATRSSIPNSGLGLWLSITCVRPTNPRKSFTLERGEKVDLGVYAPLLLQDFKKEHVLSLKSFIYNGESEGWSFDSKKSEESGGSSAIFDITCDATGELHAAAQRNVIVYANETDGKTKAAIHPQHGPEGSVHYYLGSDKDRTSFPADGTAIELKIDYGSGYEKVRVRKGYPRVSGARLKAMQQEIAEEEDEIVRELKSSSAHKILESVDFLEPVVRAWRLNGSAPGLSALKRTLLVTVTLQSRLKELSRLFEDHMKDKDGHFPFCDDANKVINKQRIGNRLRMLLVDLCRLFASASQLKTLVMQQPLFVSVLAQASGKKDPGVFKSTTPGQLRSIIEKL